MLEAVLGASRKDNNVTYVTAGEMPVRTKKGIHLPLNVWDVVLESHDGDIEVL